MSIRHIRPILLKRGRNRASRPKTFTSEESAKAWAKENGLEKYTLKDLSTLSSQKRKFRLVY